MIKTILVPTDGSDHANKAVDLAGDIASKYGARIIVLHVMMSDATIDQLQSLARSLGGDDDLVKELDRLAELPMETAAFAGDNVPVMIPVPQEVLKQVGELVTAAARDAAEAKGVANIAVEIVGGRATEAIIAAAERDGADMIVMGSRGFGDLKGLLLGSVSHKVSNLAPCTCVTVK